MKRKEFIRPLTEWQKLHRVSEVKNDLKEKVCSAFGWSEKTFYNHMNGVAETRAYCKPFIAQVYGKELNEIFPPQTTAV